MIRLKYFYLGLIVQDPVCVKFCLKERLFLIEWWFELCDLKGSLRVYFFSQFFYCFKTCLLLIFLTVALNQARPFLIR
jgi:hypothetical protein